MMSQVDADDVYKLIPGVEAREGEVRRDSRVDDPYVKRFCPIMGWEFR